MLSALETTQADAVSPPTVTDWPRVPPASAVEKLMMVAFADEEARKPARAAIVMANLSMCFSTYRLVWQPFSENSPLLPKR